MKISKSKFRSRTTLRPIILIFFILSLAIGITGYFYYQKEKQDIKKHEYKELATIADLKVAQIKSWREERMKDANFIFRNSLLTSQLKKLSEDPTSVELKREILSTMIAVRENFQYDNVLLLNNKGNIALSALSQKDNIHVHPYVYSLLQKAILGKQIIFSDLYQDNDHNIFIDVVIPLFMNQKNNTLHIGSVILRINPYNFLYPLIQSWPTPTMTAESLLVRQEGEEVVFLNELRHRKEAAFTLRFPISERRLPAAMALRGTEGVTEGVDYRGIPVLASIRAIPDLPWFLIAQIDMEEVYEPYQQRFKLIVILTVAFIFIAGLSTSILYARRQTHFLYQQHETEIQRLNILEKYENLSKHANDIILTLNLKGDVTDANERAISSYGYTRDELLQLNLNDLRAPETRTTLLEQLEQVREQNGLIYETIHQRKDGTTFPVEVSSRRIEAEGVAFYQNIMRNITERKRAQEALEWLRRRNELILNSAGEGIIGLDQEGKHTFVNLSAAKMIGYEVEELIGQRSHTIFHHTKADGTPYPEEACPIYAAYRDGAVHHVRDEVFWRKDGTSFPVAYTSTPILEDGKLVGAVVTFRDITERKRSAEMLAKALNEQKNIMDTIPDIVYMLDMSGNLVKWNKKAEFLSGFSSKELMGKYVLEFFPEQDKIAIAKSIQEAFEKGFTEVEGNLLRKDATIVPYEWNSVPFKDEQENVIGLVGVGRDITERKRAEEEIRKLNEELEQKVILRTAQLKATNKDLEAFSYSVSHDLKAPLRTIEGFSRILSEDYSDKFDDEGKRFLDIVQSSIKKMGEIIEDILALSQIGRKEIKMSEIDMDKLAKSVFDEIKATIPEREIQFDIKPLPPAYGEEGMLRQVFINLLSNAVKFTRYRENAIIEVGGDVEDTGNVYYVKDNGIGFDMQHSHKLFDAFQRLHSNKQFEGTGVGLAIVQRVIQRHGGRIWAEGKVNEGATFYFLLPNRQIRILILEDVPDRSEMMEFELQRAEIPFISKIVKTRDDFVRDLHNFDPDIILSSYYLHGFTGTEALAIAQEESVNVPFIIVTGELDEKNSVEILKKGATYIFKDNLSRLPSIVLSALC